jgi:hypothetical protein
VSGAFDTRLDRMLAEGDGLLVARFYTVRELFAVMHAAQAQAEEDDTPIPDAIQHVITLFGSIASRAVHGPPDDRPLCMACHGALTQECLPAAIGVVEASVARPTCGMVFGFCRDCVTSADGRAQLAAFCDRFDRLYGCRLTRLNVHPQVGHA